MTTEEVKIANLRTLRLAGMLALLGVLIVFGAVRVAHAQSPTPAPVTEDQVNAVAGQLYCPVCENVPLDVCGTQACAQWRSLIREKLAQGQTEQQIKDYFVNYYGDRVLAEPPRRGLNWLVYVLPPVFILGGVLILIRVLRNMRPAPAASAPAPDQPASSDPYVSRFEEQVRKAE